MDNRVQIFIETYDGGFFDGWAEWEDIDQEATIDKYYSLFEEAIRNKFPNADIEIVRHKRTTGPTCIIIWGADYWEEERIRDEISYISDRLFNDSESWIVLKNPA